MRDWKRFVREQVPLPEVEGADEECIVDELAGQLEDLYREARARGASEPEADAYARTRLGDSTALAGGISAAGHAAVRSRTERLLDRGRERAHARGGRWVWLVDVTRDVRYSLRTLRRSPGFTIVALLTLALGIGAVTTVFSLVNGVLLSPLRYTDSEELVYMWERLAAFENASVSYPNFLDWRERNRVFEDLAAFNACNMTLTGVGDPTKLDIVRVSASMFPILRARPLLGRTFLPEEDKLGVQPVAVLTHAFWQARLGGDPEVVGRTLTLDGFAFEVVGVMPPEFVFPPQGDPVDIYAPIELFAEDWIENRGDHPGIAVLGRLRPGVTVEPARSDMERVAVELEAEYAPMNEGSRVHVWSLRERMTRDSRQPMLLLLLAVGLLLLIACANVANLVLARGAGRQREIAIRTSMGANGPRIVRLLVTESLILWLVSGGVGIGVAHFATRAVVRLRPEQILPVFQVGIDVRVVVVTLAVALATGVVFGLVPALRAIRPNLVEHLKEGARSSGGVGRNRVRSALVIAEVSLAVALLVAAGLTVRSLERMINTDLGFQPENVLSVEIHLPEARYPGTPERTAFFHELLDRVRALPGVQVAATSFVLPVSPGGWQSAFHVEGEPPEEGGALTFAEVSSVSSDYFGTMGIPLIAGRDVTRGDGPDAPPVVIVDEAVAQRYWPNADPLGKRLKFGGYVDDNSWMEVVGVAGHVRVNGALEDALPQLYIPHWQDNDDGYFLVVKTAGEPSALVEPIRQAVLAIDPSQPISSTHAMTEYVRASADDGEFLALLLGIFAAAALLLAAVGIYGLMAQATSERRHEIGVRVVLGATDREVLGMIVRQGMVRVGVGIVFGLVLAAALGRLMAGRLFGVSALDPMTFVVAPLFLATVALAANLVPARQVLSVDPVHALHAE